MPRNWPRLPHTDPVYRILQALEHRLPAFMARRQSLSTGFLECGAVVDSLHTVLAEEIARLPHAPAAAAAAAAAMPTTAPNIRFHKIEIGVLRNDATTGRDGSHWALLVQVGSQLILIDATWLQFDIPIKESHGDYGYVQRHYPSLLTGFTPFVAHGSTREEAIYEWKSFLIHRAFTLAVRHPEFHDSTHKAGS